MIKGMLDLQDVLLQSEKSSLTNNLSRQKQQLDKLLKHAYASVPFYQKYNFDTEFANLPVLTRKSMQIYASSLISQNLPTTHGQTYLMETSGSTGESVQVLHTDFTRLFYDALMLRDHYWHARDFSQKLMVIRGFKQDFFTNKDWLQQSSWGEPIDNYHQTGPSACVDVSISTAKQIEAILSFEPHYILSFPSQLCALATYSLENKITMPSVKELRTTGERLTEHQIHFIQSAWPGAKINDVYSCVEIGNIAQQCPQNKQYHVNLEHVYLEVVDYDNNPCPIGVPGKVLVTSLMNYATPLIRYDLGDIATLQDCCPCGRGLPVLKNILGRSRNRLKLANSENRFPYLGERDQIAAISNVRIQKFQFVQHSLDDIEIKVVSPDRGTEHEERQIKNLYKKILGAEFDFRITYHEDIIKGVNGKSEDFISYVD